MTVRVSRIITMRRRIYMAIWAAVDNVWRDANDPVLGEYLHEITAAEYGPVEGAPIAVRVDIPRYRNTLPALPRGATRWVLLGAMGGVPEWDTASGVLADGDLGFTRDGYDEVFLKVPTSEAPILADNRDLMVLGDDDPNTVTVMGFLDGTEIIAGEIIR